MKTYADILNRLREMGISETEFHKIKSTAAGIVSLKTKYEGREVTLVFENEENLTERWQSPT